MSFEETQETIVLNKWSLCDKVSFDEAKNLLFFATKAFLKKIDFLFYFFFTLIFFVRLFWCVDIKNKIKKKYYFDIFLNKKYFEKQS